eukprot:CAMPEP_0194335546 /NCGR_PEP_ID=MMETSP0171-20130528/69979_1 /TAXON_ID=218684 /ORGANISM="Corethron pennatum, Strain L29A3" /LENGTH=398 /DNA_ID=CAMNT_0039098683 /DNA_START=222 /DNA_END=1415 /DNA_ORIENTATION=+
MAPDGRSCPNCRTLIEMKAPATHPADEDLEGRVARYLTTHAAATGEHDGGPDRAARAVRDREILTRLASGAARSLPVFYMRHARDTPGAVVDLFLFEPRYKILIRRAWEGDRTFICVDTASSSGSCPREGDVGLLVRIEQANFTRDRRAQVRGKGLERVTLGKCWQEADTGGLWYSTVESMTRDTHDAAVSAENDIDVAITAAPTNTSNTTSDAAAVVRRRLASAISEGAPAYNRGRIEFCARRYLREAMEILADTDLRDGIGRDSGSGLVEDLRAAAVFAQRELSNRNGAANEAAWKLRRSFDAILRYTTSSTGAQIGRNTSIVSTTATPSSWLPVFYDDGLRVPVGRIANFTFFEQRYKTLALEVMRNADRLFLCCSSAPETGNTAILVRMESCEW